MSPLLPSSSSSPSHSSPFPSSSSSSFSSPPFPSLNSTSPPPSPSAAPPSLIAPNLPLAPLVVSVLGTPDMATGCTYPARRRILSATRFSARVGADRQLYASTFMTLDHKNNEVSAADAAAAAAAAVAAEDPSDGPPSSDFTPSSGSLPPPSEVVPIGGAWRSHASTLSTPARNPMALELDHESCVVGCADGTVYRLGFVGSTYGLATTANGRGGGRGGGGDGGGGDEEEEEEEKRIVRIADLLELREVWHDLMLPKDAQRDHPGRLRIDLLGRAVGLK